MKMRLGRSILALTFIALTAPISIRAQGAPDERQSQLDIFGSPRAPSQANEHVWRSGRPTEQMLRDLYAKGVRTVIDLEDNYKAIPIEADWAKQIGFTFYSFPTDSFMRPDDAKIQQILEIIKDSPEPVLVHCYHGEDRTGLVIGLERVLIENWPAAKAYQEMLDMGFHRLLLGLDQYFRDKVGPR